MLAQEDNDKNERTIYYLSKKFYDYETRYTPMVDPTSEIQSKVCGKVWWAIYVVGH